MGVFAYFYILRNVKEAQNLSVGNNLQYFGRLFLKKQLKFSLKSHIFYQNSKTFEHKNRLNLTVSDSKSSSFFSKYTLKERLSEI